MRPRPGIPKTHNHLTGHPAKLLQHQKTFRGTLSLYIEGAVRHQGVGRIGDLCQIPAALRLASSLPPDYTSKSEVQR